MRHNKWILIALLALTPTACETARHRPNNVTVDEQAASTDSGIDISYVLGHNHRRFVTTATNQTIIAQTLLDRQILKESPIDKDRYVQFLKKAWAFVNQPSRLPAAHKNSDLPCRAPYIVTIRIQKDVHTASGCRSTDPGNLSKLIKDGEFLLYSKK